MRTLLSSLFSIMILTAGLFAQQMPDISQIGENLTFYNPGAIGNQEVLTAIFTYRKKFAGFEGMPTTQIFSAHAPLKNPDVAMGIVLEHDALGGTNYTGVYLNYAYRIDVGNNKLSFGLKGGINSGSQKYIELRDEEPDLVWSDQNSTFYVPNFGAGVLFYGKRYWAGLSIPRLFTYKNDASDKYHLDHDFSAYQYYLAGGGTFELGPTLSLDPSLLFIYCPTLDPSLMLDIAGVYKNTLSAGVGYRKGIESRQENVTSQQNNAIILLLSYNLNRQFSMGYSYDYEIGDLANYYSGSHEITLIYKFGYQVNASNPRQF
jgi:type IX secretion system PorP/SprF family membrane protein